MMWKFVAIWSLRYKCNIDVKSTWIRHSVPVGLRYTAFTPPSVTAYQTTERLLCKLSKLATFVQAMLPSRNFGQVTLRKYSKIFKPKLGNYSLFIICQNNTVSQAKTAARLNEIALPKARENK